MATIVCQGLQSCLESQVVESRTLRLKLQSPKPLFSQSLELALKPCSAESSHTNEFNEIRPDNGGWSFLQDLSNSSLSNKEKENVYIHPLMKRYSSKLSEKSLELCTESLGCETGSDISSDNFFMFDSSVSSSSASESEEENEEAEEEIWNSNFPAREEHKPRQFLEKSNRRSFPPPLTTMSGAESLQVRPHREDGRLIITAVKAPAIRSCFQAERIDGRLRLSFVNSNFDENENENENEEEAENDAEEEEEEEIREQGNCDESEIEEERDTEGINIEDGGEMGKKEEFEMRRRRRNSRCKEENKGLLNWEPFWVATS